MSFLMILRIALKALGRNKMRTALTMLGMIIGVAAVITMVALGSGAQTSIEAQIQSAGTNMIIVSAGNFSQGGVRQGQGNASTLVPDDAAAIAQLNQAIVIDSTRPVARLWLGVALLETGDLPSAERELTKALVMGGAECIAAHYHLARLYLSRGDTAEAIRAVESYLNEAPKGEYANEARQLEKRLKQQSKPKL